MFPSMIFFHAHDKAGIHRLRLDISFPTARLPASVLVPVYKLSVSRRHHSWTNTCFLCVRLRSLKETKNCHKNTFLFCQISKERLETLPPGWHLHRWPAGCKTLHSSAGSAKHQGLSFLINQMDFLSQLWQKEERRRRFVFDVFNRKTVQESVSW